MLALPLALALSACEVEGTDEELDGGTLYLDHCERCHGYDGRGTDFGADLGQRARDLTVDEVADTILLGEGSMDPLDLDESEAEAVAAFVLDVLVQP